MTSRSLLLVGWTSEPLCGKSSCPETHHARGVPCGRSGWRPQLRPRQNARCVSERLELQTCPAFCTRCLVPAVDAAWSCSCYVPSTVLGNRPPEEGLSLLLRSFLGEEEAQTEECSHNVLSAAKETSQGHWMDRQEGGSLQGAGWVREPVRGGAQRPWKQVKRRVAGQEEGHGG